MKLNPLNDMARTCRLLSLSLLLAVGLAGCKTSRHLKFSVRRICLPFLQSAADGKFYKDATLTVNGTMKLLKEECMQISLDADTSYGGGNMEVTPDEILLVDRMGKRYVRNT